MARIKLLIANKSFVFIVYAILALLVSFQAIYSASISPEKGTEEYNNYTIFKQSSHHLISGENLYREYPEEHWDLYKYTPTFSVAFSVLAFLPDWLGLSIWILLNVFIVYIAIFNLPKTSDLKKGLIALMVSIELVTSIQNEQSNGLIAGLIILAFVAFEKHNPIKATLFILITAFVKLFGIVAFALAIFYPNKIKISLSAFIWATILFLLPIALVGWNGYLFQLNNFVDMLKSDFDHSYGYSVMGWLETWFQLAVNKEFIVVLGGIILMVPLCFGQIRNNYQSRLLFLCSILIWIVIFNHKAESPTFIIAMLGITIWFINSDRNWLNWTLFITAFILTSLSPTDIFPHAIREQYVKPYVLKGVPSILIWIKIQFDLYRQIKYSTPVQTLTH